MCVILTSMLEKQNENQKNHAREALDRQLGRQSFLYIIGDRKMTAALRTGTARSTRCPREGEDCSTAQGAESRTSRTLEEERTENKRRSSSQSTRDVAIMTLKHGPFFWCILGTEVHSASCYMRLPFDAGTAGIPSVVFIRVSQTLEALGSVGIHTYLV